MRSADQLGRHQNPSSSKRSAASLSSAKQLVSVEPSSMVCTTKLAIAGVRFVDHRKCVSPRRQDRRSQSKPPTRIGNSGHALSLPHLLCSARDFAKETWLCCTCPHHAPVRTVLRAWEAGFSQSGWRLDLNFGTGSATPTASQARVGLPPRDVVPLTVALPNEVPNTLEGCHFCSRLVSCLGAVECLRGASTLLKVE